MELQKARDHENAIKTFDNAIEEFSVVGQADSIKALIHHRLGVSHYRLKNRLAAIEAWEEAIDLRMQFLTPNHIDIIKTHINIANGYLTLNEYRNANTSLNTALELLHSQKEKDTHNLSRVYESLGLTAKIQGDYESAKEYLSQSFVLKREMFPEEPWELINITTRLFDIYKDLGESDKMLEYAQLSLQYSEATPNDGDQYYFDLANSNNNLGIVYSSISSTNEAISHLGKSILINKRFEDRKDFLAFNYNNLILQYNRQEDYQLALEYAQKAKEIFLSDPSFATYLADTYVEEGDVYFQMGNYKKALESFHLAIQQLVVTSEPIRMDENPTPDQLIIGSRFTLMDALYKKSNSQFHEGLLQSASQTSGRLLDMVYDARRRISDRESKKYLLSSTKKFFELAIEIQYALFIQSSDVKHLQKAMSLFDGSKSSILYDALAQNAQSTTSGVAQDLIDKERNLFTELTNLEFDLLETEDEAGKLMLRDSMLNYRNHITQVRDNIFQLMNSSIHFERDESIYQIDQIQNDLGNGDQCFVQYFVGERNSYAIGLSNDEYHFLLIDSSIHLRAVVSIYLQELRNYKSEAQAYVQAGLPIYELLIGSIFDNRVFSNGFIIPDDIVSFVPFEALPMNEWSSGGFENVDFMMRKTSVRYASSFSVFQLQRQHPASRIKSGFVGMSSDYKDSPDFAQMSQANSELLAVNEIIKGDVFLNDDATKAHFLEIQDEYRNMHLSLHGIVDREAPSLSYLQFPADNQNPSEGRLYTAEVYNMDLSKDMVVLSACETGSGLLAKGEGILSLAHAFAYAGAKSSIMSLWQIPSSSTSDIFESFYKGIDKGLQKDDALRTAKLEYLDNTKAAELTHPFYWAALVQYGDPIGIDFRDGGISWQYFVVIALIAFLVYLISLKRPSASS